jgi:hypothetical protein
MGCLTKIPLVAKLAGAMVLACLAAALGSFRGTTRGESMDDWEIDDLVARLSQTGLEFRVFPTQVRGDLNNGAFLTTSNKPFAQLDALAVFPERIGQWHGTVKCYRICRSNPEWTPRTELWGDECYCRVGPFILFGDAELRTEICKALCASGISLR